MEKTLFDCKFGTLLAKRGKGYFSSVGLVIDLGYQHLHQWQNFNFLLFMEKVDNQMSECLKTAVHGESHIAPYCHKQQHLLYIFNMNKISSYNIV